MAAFDENGMFYARLYRKSVYASITIQANQISGQPAQSITDGFTIFLTLRYEPTVEMRLPIAYFAAAEDANSSGRAAAERLQREWKELVHTVQGARSGLEIIHDVQRILGPVFAEKRVVYKQS